MLTPPLHPDEQCRLSALRAHALLDTPPEPVFDDLVQVASTLCGTPIALLSLVDADRQWFKASFGLAASQTPRDLAFCAHAILTPDQALVVEDATADVRFQGNPLVDGEPRVVFYAGIPLHDMKSGLPLGTLCVIDHHARTLDAPRLAALHALARQAERQLDIRKRLLSSATLLGETGTLADRLQLSETRLRTVLAASPVGIYITDPVGNCTYVNPAWCAIAGIAADAAAGTGWVTAVHPDDRAVVSERWYSAARAHVPFTSEHRFRHHDGREVWTSVTTAEIVEHGVLLGYVGMVRDRTDRKRLEDGLRIAEERWSVALDSAGHGVWDWDAGTDRVFLSDGWKRMFGYRPEEIGDQVAEWRAHIHPDDRARVMTEIARHLAGKTPVYTCEHRVRCHDGSWKWILDRGRVVAHDPDGRARRVVGTHTDLSERRLVENALRVSQAQLVEAQEIARLGSWSYDPSSGVVVWSAEVFAICARDPSAGPPDFAAFARAIHPDDWPNLDRLTTAALHSGEPFACEHRILLPAGGVRHVLSRGRARLGSDGRANTLSGTIQDITETVLSRQALERARDAAEVATRTKSEFLATMSHEIRTPLNGVLGMTELLLGTPLAAEQREWAAAAHTCGHALLTLINDILDLSKLEAGRVVLERTPFDPRVLAEEAAAMLADAAQSKGVELYVDATCDLPAALTGDPARLRQIAINLVGNAVKFTASGEVEVRLSGAPAGDGHWTLRLAVRDTGVGIPADRQDHLFQPFMQGDSATNRRFGGSGLGLVICRRLARLMDGDITLISAAGRGSTFTLALTLPIAAAAVVDADAAPLRRTVIVADPHPGARAATVSILTAAGLTVEALADAEAVAVRLHHQRDRPVDVLVIAQTISGDLPACVAGWRQQGSGLPPLIVTTPVARRSALPADLAAAVVIRPIRRAPLLAALTATLHTPDRTPTAPPLPAAPIAARVLVAEDNPINQRMISVMLARIGCTVTVVNDGALAVAACAAQTFDLVLMDCQMPDVDGFTACRQIRALAGAAGRLPIVALTANALDGDRTACLAAGMDDYLSKPVTAADLRRVLAIRVPTVV